jgi:parvulin-like peptidyl-prolyl isomerase
MRKFRTIFIFLFCFLNFMPACFPQDKIIAIVNNDVVTQKDLDNFIAFMRLQLSSELKGKQLDDKIESMKGEFVDRLIEDKIILQEAKKNKFTIDDNRIKGRIAEIRKQYPSDTEFQEALRRQGLVQADIESKVRDQMLMYGIIENKVRNKIVISPAEVTDFYQQNPANFKSSQIWELDFLVLESKDMAAEIAQAVRNGQPLEAVAGKYSLSASKLSMKEGQFKKDVEAALLKLKPGDISDALNLGGKYYIFKLNSIVPPRQLTLPEAQESINSYLFSKKMQEGLEKWLNELRKQSYIKIIA